MIPFWRLPRFSYGFIPLFSTAVRFSRSLGNKNCIYKGVSDIVKIILAVILPPLGVFFEVGLTKHFWINLILTLFGYIPGIIHALWVIFNK